LEAVRNGSGRGSGSGSKFRCYLKNPHKFAFSFPDVLWLKKQPGGENMFKLFKHVKPKKSSKKLNVNIPDYDIVFKPGAIQTIKEIKGWKTDAEMSRALGVSKSYICGLKKQTFGVTSTVITRIAHATGNVEENWHIFYDLKFLGFRMSSDPKWNNLKYNGEMPYSWKSKSAALRNKDYGNEPIECSDRFNKNQKKLDKKKIGC
jgi:hypothetical protein